MDDLTGGDICVDGKVENGDLTAIGDACVEMCTSDYCNTAAHMNISVVAIFAAIISFLIL